MGRRKLITKREARALSDVAGCLATVLLFSCLLGAVIWLISGVGAAGVAALAWLSKDLRWLLAAMLVLPLVAALIGVRIRRSRERAHVARELSDRAQREEERRRAALLGATAEQLDELHPDSFEQWIVEVLLHHGIEAERVGGSGDFGADVLAGPPLRRVAIQAKRYTTGAVGNGAVAEVRQGIDYYRCVGGMVVTQSRFTRAARQAASRSSSPITLIERENLHDLAMMCRLLIGASGHGQ